MARTGGFRL